MNILEKIRAIDELIHSNDFETAAIRWKELNLVDKIVKVEVSDRFTFQAAHDAIKWDKKELKDITKFRLIKEIREKFDKLIELKETTHYKEPSYIEHECSMIILKP